MTTPPGPLSLPRAASRSAGSDADVVVDLASKYGSNFGRWEPHLR